MPYNKEKWNNLDSSGTITEREGIRYPYVLGGLAASGALIASRLKINWWRFTLFVLVGSIVGWAWNYYTVIADPRISGWMYPPGTYLCGDFNGMVGLDFLFYPICGGLFGLLKMVLPKGKACIEKRDIVVFMFVAALLYTLLLSAGAASITIAFVIPALFMAKKVNKLNFILTGVIIIVLAGLWDIFLPSWVYYFPDNTPHHSVIWSEKYWIHGVPMAILPYFSISGWWFIYFLHERICGLETNRVK